MLNHNDPKVKTRVCNYILDHLEDGATIPSVYDKITENHHRFAYFTFQNNVINGMESSPTSQTGKKQKMTKDLFLQHIGSDIGLKVDVDNAPVFDLVISWLEMNMTDRKATSRRERVDIYIDLLYKYFNMMYKEGVE